MAKKTSTPKKKTNTTGKAGTKKSKGTADKYMVKFTPVKLEDIEFANRPKK